MAIVKGIPGVGDVNFPEEMSNDEINAAVKSLISKTQPLGPVAPAAAAAPEKPIIQVPSQTKPSDFSQAPTPPDNSLMGTLGQLGLDMSKRGQQLSSNAQRFSQSPSISNLGQLAYQQTGVLAGGANDVLSRGASFITQTGNELLGGLPGQAVKAVAPIVSAGIDKLSGMSPEQMAIVKQQIANNPQAMSGNMPLAMMMPTQAPAAVNQYQQSLQQTDPTEAANFGAGLNIGNLGANLVGLGTKPAINAVAAVKDELAPAISNAVKVPGQVLSTAGQALSDVGVGNIPAKILPHVDAMVTSLPTKVEKDLASKVGNEPLAQRQELSNIIVNHGLDQILDQPNKNVVRSQIINMANNTTKVAEDKLLDPKLSLTLDPNNLPAGISIKPGALSPVADVSGKQLVQVNPNQVMVNPWRIAEDAIEANKAQGSLGNFTGVKAAPLQNAYETLQASWAPEWYKQVPLEDAIAFKRDVLNKNGDLFSKASAIDVPESSEKTLKKIIYQGLNDKLGQISPDYLAGNRDAKDLYNLSAAVKAYTPPTSKPLISGVSIGAGIGGTVGGVIGGQMGHPLIGAEILGSLGGSIGGLLGNMNPRPKPTGTWQEGVGNTMQTLGNLMQGQAAPVSRYQQAVNAATPIKQIQANYWANFSKKGGK